MGWTVEPVSTGHGRLKGAAPPRCGGASDHPVNDASAAPPIPTASLCLHHDNASERGSGWYAWDESTGNRCVVSHGLYHSRLTENGTLPAVGGHYQTDFARWDDAWAGRMYSLKRAAEVYLGKASACNRAAYEATIP